MPSASRLHAYTYNMYKHHTYPQHNAFETKKPAIRQKQENKQRSSIRYIVERTFGLLKQHHGLAKCNGPINLDTFQATFFNSAIF